jgi:NADH-quinone oxidoreductase subunit L
MNALCLIMIGLPLFGSIIPYVCKREKRKKLSQILPTFFVGVAFLLSCHIVYFVTNTNDLTVSIFPWIFLSDYVVNWQITIDALSAVMFVIVTFVSFCVHLYSISYMKKDKSFDRFMSYLSLFTFMMLLLVSASNLLQLFVGWEGVGLCSYLLIGFWFEKKRACNAAYKAFIVNRIGDFFFVLGLAIAFLAYGSLDFSVIFNKEADILGNHASLWVCGLFFMGAMAKSAQIGLHVWLPDAMEGPTPVSALIHAATMVTAGVFLLIRFSPVLVNFDTLNMIILYVGAVTAFYAGTVAIAQNDLKRIIAFSTCSQLGYMMMAIGVKAYSAALFHLVTHAFFKALLFLTAGAIISISKGEQDIHRMPEIKLKAPIVYSLMWIGSLALVGAPFLSGFYSKDLIIETIFQEKHAMIPYIIALFSVFLTAVYSIRVLIYIFHKKPKDMDLIEVKEVRFSILGPLLLLSIPSVASGYLLHPYFSELAAAFFRNSMVVTFNKPVVQPWQEWLPTIIGLGTLVIFGYIFAKKEKVISKFIKLIGWGHKFFVSKWYFDEIFKFIIVNPFIWMSSSAVFLNNSCIEKYGPNGIARVLLRSFNTISRMQTGAIYHYILYIFTGVSLIIGIYLLG